MGNWLKRKIQIASVKAATEDLERFLKSLRGASDEEIGMLVVVATMIRVNLRKKGRLHDEYLRIPTPGDGSGYAPLFLSRLIKTFQKNGQPTDASGAMVWLHTVRSLAFPELRVLGREMWGELHRGFPYVERSFSEIEAMTNSPVSDMVRIEAKFLPSDLAPLIEKDDTRRHIAGPETGA